ncbi:MAG: CBS domain-containing protein [Haloarculaceae archaeon]
MTVDDLAREDPIAATKNASIAQVASLMADHEVGSVVIEEDGRPVGIVTDRDITIELTAQGRDPDDVTAEEVMTGDVVTIDRDGGLFDLVALMAEHQVRRVPVVDDDELYGIITLDDIDRLLASEQQKLADVIEAESPPY